MKKFLVFMCIVILTVQCAVASTEQATVYWKRAISKVQNYKDYTSALTDINDSIKEFPKSRYTRMYKIYILHKLGNYKSIITEATEDIALFSNNSYRVVFPYYRGLAKYAAGDYKGAISDFGAYEDNILDYDMYYATLEGKARCYWQLGQKDEAMKVLERLHKFHWIVADTTTYPGKVIWVNNDTKYLDRAFYQADRYIQYPNY